MDLHPDQVLLTKSGPRIIDWETACQGNPLADVARTSIILRVAQKSHSMQISDHAIDRIRESFFSAYLDQYFKGQAKKMPQELNAWELVMATARLAESIDGEESELKAIVDEKLNVN